MCLGQNNQAGKSILKTDYAESNTLSANIKLAAKILSKTMDSTTPSPDRIELSVMRRTPTGAIVHELLPESEVTQLLETLRQEQEAEQKLAEASTGNI